MKLTSQDLVTELYGYKGYPVRDGHEEFVDAMITKALENPKFSEVTIQCMKVLIHRYGLKGETAKTIDEISKLEDIFGKQVHKTMVSYRIMKGVRVLRHPGFNEYKKLIRKYIGPEDESD